MTMRCLHSIVCERPATTQIPACAARRATRSHLRHPPPDEPRRHWLACVDDEPVGRGELHFTETLVWMLICVVPAHRRRGIGNALFDTMFRRQTGTTLAGFFAGEPGAAFAHGKGAKDEQRDVRSVLDLATATLPEPRVPDGYALRSWTDAAPEDLLESYARARNAINDAPAPEGQSIRQLDSRLRALA